MVNRHTWAIGANRLLYWSSRQWLLVVSALIGVYVGLPWLAPLFMAWGWTSAGKLIYLVYATQCHQMPQRSFFLFGERAMYSLAEIQSVWQNTNDPLVLRQFVGNPELGWKVAWSDRMVSMYASLLFWGILFWPVRKRTKPLPAGAFVLLLLPMAVDGVTHMISDWTVGIGLGFRYHNAWLAGLTDNRFSPDFYAGDALGSFNSWMRLISGLFFGLAVVWYVYPQLHYAFTDVAVRIKIKFQEAGQDL